MVKEAVVMMSAAMRLNDVPRDKLIAMRGTMPGVQATVASPNSTGKVREPTV
jgi:hypothetical protein